MITKQFTQTELDALYDCIVYLMECEQTHYEESLQDDEPLDNHVYVKALDAFNAINRAEVTA
jgi:hypothetical protein